MIERYRQIQRERAAGEREDSGFTLIELLIVIVVLGILAAVVIFALGGVAGKSAVASCNSDAKTVETAVAAWQAQNPGVAISTINSSSSGTGTATVETDTGLTGTANGGPYLHTFPNNSQYYLITVVSGVVDVTTSPGSTTPPLTAYDSETSSAGCSQA
jgi:general secretion pathway protein G